MSDLTGQQLGNYRLIHKIGSGGFAHVYRAEHIYLNTQVAIKVLIANLASSDMQNFLNEAQYIARLDHPHIVRVRDFGIERGTPYLVMDYAPNGTLRQRHPKGTQVALPLVVTYVEQLASALQYAHTQHMIHRDVKPDNILLGNNNKLLLSDFGAALVTRTTQQLNPQNIIGTLAYMAPEQLQGNPSPASDQYALGVVVYEWLCGYCPFEGAAAMYRHLNEPPPSLCARVPTLSYVVEQVVMKALAKQSKQRFDNVQSFAEAFERASKWTPAPPLIIHGNASSSASPTMHTMQATQTVIAPPQPLQRPQPVAPPPPVMSLPVTIAASPSFPSRPPLTHLPPREPRPSRRMVLHSAIGLVAAGGIVGLAVALMDHQGTKASFSTPEPTGTKPVYSYKGHTAAVFTAAWSLDGRYIASAGGNNDSPNSSPNSREGDTKVRVWEARTGRYVNEYTGHSRVVRMVAWSPHDGKRIASASEDGTVQVWDATTGNRRATYPHNIDEADEKANNELVMTVAWSPDEKRIASASNDKTVQVWNATSGQQIYVYSKHAAPVVSLAWSPDGKLIASASRDGVVQVWDAVTGIKRHSLSYNVRVGALAWSPDNTHIAIGYYNTDNGAGNDVDDSVRIWDINTENSEQIIPGTFGDLVYALDWSSDGKYIAAGYQKGEVRIWSSNAPKQTSHFGAHSGPIMGVQWSPHDSRYLVTCGFDHRVKIWMLS